MLVRTWGHCSQAQLAEWRGAATLMMHVTISHEVPHALTHDPGRPHSKEFIQEKFKHVPA